MQEELPSKSFGIPQQELDLFVQSHTLAQIYQKFLRSCSSQAERIQHIKDFLNLKSSKTQPSILISQMDDLIKQEGTQFSKNQLFSHLQICQTILQYLKTLQNNQNQQSQLPNQGIKDSECLLITIYLNTIRMIYFQSQKSWMQSQRKQMKFQFKCLLFDLLNQVIISIQLLPEEQGQIKLIELIQLMRENNLINNLLTRNMHLQILKKVHHIFSFSLQFNIISQQRFFGLIGNYLNKSIQQKRVSQEILGKTFQNMPIEYVVKSLDFVQYQILNFQPKLIQDSSVRCIEGLLNKISKNKESFLVSKQNEIKVNDLVSKVKEMSEQIEDRFGIRSQLNKVYYEAVHQILRSVQIKKKIVNDFYESMVRMAKYLQAFCLDQQIIRRQNKLILDRCQLEKQIQQIVDNFIKLIGSFEYLSQDQRQKQKQFSIIGVSKQLLEKFLINELILTCLNIVNTYKKTSKKNVSNQRKQQIFNTSIRKFLQLLKYILLSSKSGEDKIKQEIQKVFNIIEGSMQFLDWVMQFDNSLQNEIFTCIFSNSIFGYSFKQITPLGFYQLYRKFLQLNYEKNKFLIVYFKQPEQGIRFMMKKSISFKQNLLLQNALIQVSQQDLIEDNNILQIVPVNLVMKQWQGVEFMIMLSWYSEYEQVKRKLLQLLRYSRFFQASTKGITRQSQQMFINQSINHLIQGVKKFQDKNQQKSNKNTQLIKGIVHSLGIFIKETNQGGQLQQQILTMSNLSTLNRVQIGIKIIGDLNVIEVDKIYQKIQSNRDNQQVNQNKQLIKTFLQNNNQHIIKLSVNNQSFIIDVINLGLRQRKRQIQQKLSLNANDYLCFISNQQNNNNVFDQSALDKWSKLSQLKTKDKQFVLVNKYLYQLINFQNNIELNSNSHQNNNNSSLNNIQISYQTSNILFRLIQSVGIDRRQLLQQIKCYWSSLQHYSLINIYLQQLISPIANQQQQNNKYKLVSLVYSNLLKDKDFIYKTFIIHLFQIISTLFQVTLPPNRLYDENMQIIIRETLQMRQNYELLFKLTQLQYLKKNNQCMNEVNNLIDLLHPCRQYMSQSVDENMKIIIQSTNYKQKTYLLRITLHKLINGSQDQLNKWRENKHVGTIIKQLEQVVFRGGMSLDCDKQQVQESQMILIQHVIIDLSYCLNAQFKQLIQRVFNVKLPQSRDRQKLKQRVLIENGNQSDSNLNPNQQLQTYLKYIIKQILPFKLILTMTDKKDNIELSKYKIVLIYQYLYLSIGQPYYHQLLIYIVQKLIFTKEFNLQSNKKMQQRTVNRKNIHMERNNTKTKRKININMKVFMNMNSEVFKHVIKCTQVINEQNLIKLIMYLVNQIGQTLNRQQQVRAKQNSNQFFKISRCSQLQLDLIEQYTNRYSHRHHQSQLPIEQNQLSQLSMQQENRVKFVQLLTTLLNKQLQSFYQYYADSIILLTSQTTYQSVVVNTLRSFSLIVRSFPSLQLIKNINLKRLIQTFLSYKQYQQQNNLNTFISPQVRVQTANLILAIASIQPKIRQQLIHSYLIPFIQYLQNTNHIVISNNNSVIEQLKQNRVGLHNYGNTCYINSLIQLLFNITPLSHDLINNQKSQSSHQQQSPLTQTIKQLKQLFTIMKHSNAKYYCPFQFVSSLQSHLNLADQQDTTQFFHIIQNQLQKSHLNHLLQHIQGTTLTTIICQNCRQSNIKKQPFLLYNVQIQNHSQLQSALHHMGKQQLISDYKCHQCGQSTTVKKYTHIYSTPQYFFIQLKRINYDYNFMKLTKIHDRLQFPQILNLVNMKRNKELNYNNMLRRQQQQEDDLLQLFGIIVHSGTGEQGHYYSYVKEQNQRWICYNDTIVTSCHKDQFIQKCYGNNSNETDWSENAYILVYRKVSKSQYMKQNEIKIEKSVIRQNIQNDLILKIREQNHNRLITHLLSQYDPITNKNVITNFIDQLLQTYKQRQQIQTALQLHLQFSFNFTHIKLPHSQFFLNRTKCLIQKYSSLLTQKHLLKYFPQDLVYFETTLLEKNQSNNFNIYNVFSYDVFLTILGSLITNKNNRIQQLQQQPTSIISPILDKYLTNIFELTPKYLNSITSDNKQTHIRLFNLVKLFNYIINIAHIKLRKHLYQLMFSKISFSLLLIKFVQTMFCQHKIDQQILKFVASIIKYINKSKQAFIMSNSRNVIQERINQKIQQQQTSIKDNKQQLNSFNIDERQVFDNVDRCKDIFVSNQFWLKTTTIIQNLTFQSIQKESFFYQIQPVFNFSLSISFQLRIKLVKYIYHKIQSLLKELREGYFIIQQLKKCLCMLRILLFNHIRDKICMNLQYFNIPQGEDSIEQEWNSLLRVRIQNPNISKGLIQTLTKLQRQMIRMGVEIIQIRCQNEKMETEQQVMMRKQTHREQQQEEQLMKKRKIIIDLLRGNQLQKYLQCLQSCLSLFMGAGELLTMKRFNNNDHHLHRYFQQKGQLQQHIVQMCTSSQIKNKNRKHQSRNNQPQIQIRNKHSLINFVNYLISKIDQMRLQICQSLNQKYPIDRVNQLIKINQRVRLLYRQLMILFNQYRRKQTTNIFSHHIIRKFNKNITTKTINRLTTGLELQDELSVIKLWKGSTLQGIDSCIKLTQVYQIDYQEIKQNNTNNMVQYEQIKMEYQHLNNNQIYTMYEMLLQININEQLAYTIQNCQLLITVDYSIDINNNNNRHSNHLNYTLQTQKHILLTIEHIAQSTNSDNNQNHNTIINQHQRNQLKINYNNNNCHVTIKCLLNKLLPYPYQLNRVTPTITILSQQLYKS